MTPSKDFELARFEFEHNRPGDASFVAGRFPDSFCKATDHWLCFCNWNIVLESVVVGHGNSNKLRLHKPHIVPDAHRAESYIEISKADPEQTQPRPKHVPAIQTTHASVGAITGWRFCNLIAKSADQMP